MLDDLKFESLIDNRAFHSNEMLEEYEKLKSELEILVKMIENGIKKAGSTRNPKIKTVNITSG